MTEIRLTIRGIARRQAAVSLAGLVLIIVIVTGIFVYLHQRGVSQTQLPASSYKDLGFKVFFPKNLPAGFRLDPQSVSSTADVLTYKYNYQNKPVVVSVQPLDPQLDISSFRPTREIDTSIGHGYLATFDNRTTIAIVAGKSFVLINSPNGISDATVEQFADSLAPVN
jgi:hypothetical protein